MPSIKDLFHLPPLLAEEVSPETRARGALVRVISPVLFAVVLLFMLTVSFVSLKNAVGLIGKPFAGFLFYDYRLVGSFGDYQWPGLRAGVRYLDVILEVNGQPIASGRDLQALIHRTPVGDKLSYLLARQGNQFSLDIPVALFTREDFLKIFCSPFLGGLIFWAIGIIAYFLKRDTATTWAFLLMSLFLGTYLATGFTIQSPTHVSWSNFINILGLVFFSAAGLHLSLLFPEKTAWAQRRPKLAVIPYGVSSLLLIALLLDVRMLTDSQTDIAAATTTAAHLRMLINFARFYALLAAVAIAASSAYAYWRSSSAIAKQRARVVLLGSGVAFLPATLAMVLVSLGDLVIPFNLLALPGVVFPATIAYAIVKHNLFDVDVYIKRAVGYIIMTAIVAFMYVTMETLVRTLLLGPLFDGSVEQVYPILFALLVVFFFNPLNRWVQDGIDRLFFRKQADYKQTILSVTNTLTSVLDLDAIVQQIMQTVKHEMFIDLVGIGVLDPRSRESYQFVMSDESAAVKNRQSDLRISREDPLLTLLAAEKHMITRYDIEEDARYAQVRAHCEPRFSALSANMVMPLIYQGEMTGVLVLGRKKSGHFYTRDDIDLLTTLANQGAVAIENAKLFTEHLEKGRLEEEMRIARNIQSGMLPDEAPRIEGVQIAATSIPAREVGGDFYDFINLQKNGLGPRVGIAVGDVAGKGISGALVMAASRSILRVLAEAHPAIEDVMHIGNLRLKNDIKKGMFVALLYAIVEPQKNTLTFANAGQTEPIFCPGDAASPPYLVATDGDRFPLGIVEKSRYQEKRVLLDKGDLVVFYTDGIVEAMNERKELYGFDRLLVSVSEGRGLAADALLKKLVTDVALHAAGGEQNDDLTLVVVKIV